MGSSFHFLQRELTYSTSVSLIWAVSASNAVVISQWFIWGYSLAFSSSATNGYIGNLKHAGLRGVLAQPSPGSPLIPEMAYSFFQMEFACVTVGILMGGKDHSHDSLPSGLSYLCSHRGTWTRISCYDFLVCVDDTRILPSRYLTFYLCNLVLENDASCSAYWAWGANGWAFEWGVLDFAGKFKAVDVKQDLQSFIRAGGGPVELGSGVAGLAYALVLRQRQPSELLNFRPHNVSLVNLGTFILWFGWLGELSDQSARDRIDFF